MKADNFGMICWQLQEHWKLARQETVILHKITLHKIIPFLDLISNNREKCNVIPDLWSFQNSDLVILRIIVWLQRISSKFTTTKNMMKNIVRLDFLFLKPTKKTFIGDTNLLIYILEMRNACMALI